MNRNQSRLDILKQVENGEINLEFASNLLSNQDVHKTVIPVQHIKNNDIDNIMDDEDYLSIDKPSWGIVFWIIPLILGGIITAYSATWMYQNYNNSGLGYRLWISFIPFVVGIFLIYLSWVLQSANWLNIVVRQPVGEKPEKIVIGFPVPIKFTAAILKIFHRFLPKKVQKQEILDFLIDFDGVVTKENPMHINVNDEDGSNVELFLV